jgi:hypothetical protein
MYRVRLILTGIALILIDQVAVSQQLKLGNNPFTVQKSAILDMESTNQGLLLVRISDTTLINALTPPDGMLIFFTGDNSLRVRRSSKWSKLLDSAIISLNGLTAYSQTFATSNNAAALQFNSSGSTHTLNIPDASASIGGIVNTTSQTFAGNKTLSNDIVISGNTTIGAKGTATKNQVSFSVAVSSTALTTGTFNILAPSPFVSGSTNITVTIPSSSNYLTSTQASVTVTPNFDLPTAVSIASARLTSTSQVSIRFVNASTTAQNIAGTFYITITEF